MVTLPRYLLADINKPSDYPVLFFDGDCNVCNRAVQFILEKEEEPIIRFATIKSETMQSILSQKPELQTLDTIFFLYDEYLYTHSDAILQVVTFLQRPYSLLSVLRFSPSSIRNFLYRQFAKRRYRWFGQSDQCIVPTPEIRERFL